MANRVLRDQCEHGRYEDHWWPDILPLQEGAEPCPGGQEITIPLGRVIVPSGATLKALGVSFVNVQVDLQDDSNWQLEFCYFDMTELTALGLDFVTIAGAHDV